MSAHSHLPQNITNPEDFWVLWNADQDAFTAMLYAEGAARSGVAALTLLAWDIVTSADKEVKLIWFSGWTLPKALYLFVRYYSLAALIFHNIPGTIPCVPWLILELWSIFAVEAAVEVIIILRIYAVYATRNKIMHIMLFGFGIQIVIMAVTLGVSIPKFMGGFYCKAADIPAEMVLYSTASIIYETFLFCLMMVGVIRGAKEGFANTTLVRVLVRDGMFAYIGLFFTMLLNTFLFTMAPTTLVTLGFPWLLAITGAAGSRLVLNLRAKHAINISGPSSLAEIHFTTTPHKYAAVGLDDLDGGGGSPPTSADEDNDEDNDEEASALNPSSRSNTLSSGVSHSLRLDGTERAFEFLTLPSPLSPEIVVVSPT